MAGGGGIPMWNVTARVEGAGAADRVGSPSPGPAAFPGPLSGHGSPCPPPRPCLGLSGPGPPLPPGPVGVMVPPPPCTPSLLVMVPAPSSPAPVPAVAVPGPPPRPLSLLNMVPAPSPPSGSLLGSWSWVSSSLPVPLGLVLCRFTPGSPSHSTPATGVQGSPAPARQPPLCLEGQHRPRHHGKGLSGSAEREVAEEPGPGSRGLLCCLAAAGAPAGLRLRRYWRAGSGCWSSLVFREHSEVSAWAGVPVPRPAALSAHFPASLLEARATPRPGLQAEG